MQEMHVVQSYFDYKMTSLYSCYAASITFVEPVTGMGSRCGQIEKKKCNRFADILPAAKTTGGGFLCA